LELSWCNLGDLASVGLALTALTLALVTLLRSRGLLRLQWLRRG
jgi:hypothetical protein